MDLINFLTRLLNKRCCDNWLSTQKKKGLDVYFTPRRSKLKTDIHSKCPLC